MGESNIKVLHGVVRSALRPLSFLLLLLAGTRIEAEPTRLSWLVGAGSDSASPETYLWNRLEVEQSLSRERFFVSGDLGSRSILSSARGWGAAFGAGVAVSLGSAFDWLPSLRLENEASFSGWDPVVQNALRYQVWSLLMDTQVAFAPLERNGARLFRLRQSIGMSLGEGDSREDFILLDLEFVDLLSRSATRALGAQVQRVGLVFVSRVEF